MELPSMTEPRSHSVDDSGSLPPWPRTVRAAGLTGRRGECDTLKRLIAAIRAGESQALVVRGDPGVGKTALLEYLAGKAADAGCAVARVVGVQSEMELAFAGLHQLCAPFLDRLGRLPDPQRDALEAAFSLRNGGAPDRFAVGLAALSLLSEVAEDQPLVCVVDDTQWLDRASAHVLTFVARHLAAAPVAMVFAVRQSGSEQDLSGLPALLVGGLADGDARALLASVVIGPLDERVRDRIVAETRGNPQALLEWPRRLMPGELAGGFGLPTAATPLTGQIEQAFRRSFESLPESTRLLLAAAAADMTGDTVLIWRAAGQLGVEAGAAAPATAASLIEFRGLVRFCHPLARAAVYWAASPQQRQRVHRALADVTDPDADPDRRAWHLAHAAPGLDEGVAAELERSAGRAGKRGGLAATAAFAERAAELTPDPACRARRALAAAQVKYQVGALDAAGALLGVAQSGPLDELGRARVGLLRAQLAAEPGRGRDAWLLLLEAASRLEPLDGRLAREAYRDALIAALAAGRLATADGMLQAAKAAWGAPRAPEPARATDLLLDGLVVLTTEGHAAGAPLVRRALAAFRSLSAPAEEALGWLPLACRMSRDAWDDDAWHVLSTRLIELARQAGALRVLPAALLEGAAVRLAAGEPATAASLTHEAQAVAQVTGNPVGSRGPLLLAAWAGRKAEAAHLITAATPEMMARGEGQWLTAAAWATAVLCNGLGRYDQALAAAERGSEYPSELGLATWSLAELIEAAARTGAPERAAGALRRLSEATSAAATDWALGIQARSRALLSDGEPAERLYLEAVQRLGRTRIRAELARAHLLYGEWLRRQNRRADAREQLRAAYEMLTVMGAEAFAERARRELLATGETVRKRMVSTAGELTAQEAQIARLAGYGHTNPEISTKLFLSPRTVEWHLRKVFTKLGISSRRELSSALPDLERVLLPPHQDHRPPVSAIA